MFRVVIDTNVLISAVLSSRGAPAQILHLFQQQLFEWLISEDIFLEYTSALRYDRVKKRHQLNDEELYEFLQSIRAVAILVKPTHHLGGVVSDPDDNKFFECALEGGAHFIVSGDAAVQAVKQYQGIHILSPALFLTMLEQEENPE
jgi:putative PIN family toxin of toxin-antitoxin system